MPEFRRTHLTVNKLWGTDSVQKVALVVITSLRVVVKRWIHPICRFQPRIKVRFHQLFPYDN